MRRPVFRTTGPRRCRTVLAVVLLLTLGAWWYVWYGVFRRASSSKPSERQELNVLLDGAVAMPEEKIVARRTDERNFGKTDDRNFGKTDERNFGKTEDTKLVYYADESCSVMSKEFVVTVGVTKDSHERLAKSFRVIGSFGRAEFFWHEQFVYALWELDGCQKIFDYPKPTVFELYPDNPMQTNKQIKDESLLAIRAKLLNIPVEEIEQWNRPAKYRIVFSVESSEYFGYQVWANKLGFLQSQLGFDATWTRLLTCQKPDDIAEDARFPTYTAHRFHYTGRYSPMNKPDVITKWFASADAPQEPVIMVIDPDSWMLKPIYEDYVTKIKPGYALGQAAYYTGSKTAQRLWRELCEKNCERDMDLVGVPYIVHRDDMAKIAPLWKYYVLKIKLLLEHSAPGSAEFAEKYRTLDVNWASEMYGYNMAAAHLDIKHEIVHDLQVRDVDGERTQERCKNKASLHMGRAWFPKNHPAAKQWIHTEGKSFSMFGDQVWCKCNFTASTIKPWPLPEGLDFVSYHTLRLLHDSEQEFGPVPENEEWRHKKGDLKHGYGWAHP